MNDNELITELGGVSALAKKLNTTPQRVCNWRKRGIPAKVKLANQKLFAKRSAKRELGQ